MPSTTFLWQAGAVLGTSGVALGAFGAHGLQKHIKDPIKIGNWRTASTYQLIHAIALLALSSSNNPNTGKPATFAGGLILTGITLFSGSIYLLVLKKDRFRFLVPVPPIGGLIMLAGWGSLLF